MQRPPHFFGTELQNFGQGDSLVGDGRGIWYRPGGSVYCARAGTTARVPRITIASGATERVRSIKNPNPDNSLPYVDGSE